VQIQSTKPTCFTFLFFFVWPRGPQQYTVSTVEGRLRGRTANELNN